MKKALKSAKNLKLIASLVTIIAVTFFVGWTLVVAAETTWKGPSDEPPRNNLPPPIYNIPEAQHTTIWLDKIKTLNICFPPTYAGTDCIISASGGGSSFWKKAATSNNIYNDPDGNVGIGVQSPSKKLEVTTNDEQGLRISGSPGGDAAGRLELGYNSANGYGRLQAWQSTPGQAKNLILQPGGGNVGIGTAAPIGTYKLVVISGTTQGGYVKNSQGDEAYLAENKRGVRGVATGSTARAVEGFTDTGYAGYFESGNGGKGVYIKNAVGNAELDIQSGNTNYWGIYHAATDGTQDLRFWNNSVGNNLILTNNGRALIGDVRFSKSDTCTFCADKGSTGTGAAIWGRSDGTTVNDAGVYGYSGSTSNGVGVHGYSYYGSGIYGRTTNGYSGYFTGGKGVKVDKLKADFIDVGTPPDWLRGVDQNGYKVPVIIHNNTADQSGGDNAALQGDLMLSPKNNENDMWGFRTTENGNNNVKLQIGPNFSGSTFNPLMTFSYNTVFGNISIGATTTDMRNTFNVFGRNSAIEASVNPGTYNGNWTGDPNNWNRAGHFKLNNTSYPAEAWIATSPYHVNASYGVFANGTTAGVYGSGPNVGIIGQSYYGGTGIIGASNCDTVAPWHDSCANAIAISAEGTGYADALKATVKAYYTYDPDTGRATGYAVQPNSSTGETSAIIATNEWPNGWGIYSYAGRNYFSGDVKIGGIINLGVNSTQAQNVTVNTDCSAVGEGTIAYSLNAAKTVGHFYGCIRTATNTYRWKQIDN